MNSLYYTVCAQGKASPCERGGGVGQVPKYRQALDGEEDLQVAVGPCEWDLVLSED